MTACAICGSDLHIYGGIIPSMEHGDIIGHEAMGEVVEVGRDNTKLKVGDGLWCPSPFLRRMLLLQARLLFRLRAVQSNKGMAEKNVGLFPAGLFGYSHMLGGFAGGQAEYMRVPFADVGPIKVPEGLTDDQVLFLSTSSHRATWRRISATSNRATPSPYGLRAGGPDGHPQLLLLGAERVIAIDTVPERLAMARASGAMTLDFMEDDIYGASVTLPTGAAQMPASMRWARKPKRCPQPTP